MRYLGAHVSVAGGLASAIERGCELGCTALQLFVKNPNRWEGRRLAEEEVGEFRERWRQSPIGPIVAHAAYLINLCAADDEILERSRRCLGDELDRSARLGLDALVVHPGAHMGRGREAALTLVSRSVDQVLDRRDTGRTRLLLEVTAGQGTVIGDRLEQLETVVERAEHGERLGVCLDTCHLFAAGYPIHTPDGIDAVLAEALGRFGRRRLGCVHLNDSRHRLGSRKDRHANIGEGEIGVEALAHAATHRELVDLPLVIETPRGDDGDGHRRDLEALRRAAGAGSTPGE